MPFKITDHGAKILHPYSQGRDFPHMKLDPKSRGGVCKALCMYWLINHAKGGDFWAWVATVKGIASVINTQSTGEVHAQRTHAFGSVPGQIEHTGDHDAWIDQMLANAGIMRISQNQSTVKFDDAAELVIDLTGQYKLIGLRGTGVGHAVCAHVGETVTFMDPNLGDVSFPSFDSFKLWFPEFVKLYKFQDTPTSPVKTFDTVIVRPFGVTRGRR